MRRSKSCGVVLLAGLTVVLGAVISSPVARSMPRFRALAAPPPSIAKTISTPHARPPTACSVRPRT